MGKFRSNASQTYSKNTKYPPGMMNLKNSYTLNGTGISEPICYFFSEHSNKVTCIWDTLLPAWGLSSFFRALPPGSSCSSPCPIREACLEFLFFGRYVGRAGFHAAAQQCLLQILLGARERPPRSSCCESLQEPERRKQSSLESCDDAIRSMSEGWGEGAVFREKVVPAKLNLFRAAGPTWTLTGRRWVWYTSAISAAELPGCSWRRSEALNG